MPLAAANTWYEDNLHTPPSRPDRFRRARPWHSLDFTAMTAVDFIVDPIPVLDASDLAPLVGRLATAARPLGRERRRWRDINPTEIRLLEPSADISVGAWSAPSRSNDRRMRTVPRGGAGPTPIEAPSPVDVIGPGGGVLGGAGTGNDWFAAPTASTRYRIPRRSADNRALADGLPDQPYELLVAVTPTGAARPPVPRRTAPAGPATYLDPGEYFEFFAVVAWDTGGTTRPAPAPTVRRSSRDDLPIGAEVAVPEVTAHVTAEVALPARPPARAARQVVQALPPDSDFLGPLPATFVYGPQAPARPLPRRPAPTDGSLRELPDDNVAILGAWQVAPQPPARPLPRVPPDGEGGSRWVWQTTLEAEVRGWQHCAQPPLPQPARRPVQAAEYHAWSPLGDPMAWDVAPQPRHLPRQRPTPHEYVAAPPVYTSGASIVVSGPFYAVATALYTAGAVAGKAVTE